MAQQRRVSNPGEDASRKRLVTGTVMNISGYTRLPRLLTFAW